MVRIGRHTGSVQPDASVSAAAKDHHVRKSVLLLAICAGAQVVLLIGVGAFGHGLRHQTLSSADLSGTFLSFGRVDDSGGGFASGAPAPTDPTPATDIGPVSVLGTFIRAAAAGDQITAATVPGVTSPVTVSGDSGALPVVPFQGKPQIPPDSTPPVPVTTPTPTPTPTPTITPTVIPVPTPTVVPLTPTPTPTPTVEPPTPTPTLTPPVEPAPIPTLTEPPIPLPTPTPTPEPIPEPTPPAIPEPPIPLPTEILEILDLP